MAITHLDKEIIEKWKSGMAAKAIGYQLGIDAKTVQGRLKINNLEYKPRPFRVYRYKSSLFKEVNTPEVAYWLGVLYADGCICGNALTLCLKGGRSETELLKKFVLFVGAGNKIQKFSFHQTTVEGKVVIRHAQSVKITSKPITDNLSALGCVPRKSLILKFPTEKQVPKKLLSHFMRGYFDGDGSVGIYNTYGQFSLVGTPEFLQKYKSLLESFICQRPVGQIRPNNGSALTHSYSCHNSLVLMSIRKFLYRGARGLFLSRKKEIFFKMSVKVPRNDRVKLEPKILKAIVKYGPISSHLYRLRHKTPLHTTKRAFRRLLSEGHIKLVKFDGHQKTYGIS